MPVDQFAIGRERVCLAGATTEPTVSAERLLAAITPAGVESFRALLPVGYQSGVMAYRQAAAELTAPDLANHYTDGLKFFQNRFLPHLRQVLRNLSGGIWGLSEFAGFAAAVTSIYAHLRGGCRA